mmetsp:Transcript_6984/g.11107  ORF Transcript_6984/g.11107 Transcript_6984/m.11107 type:complete len:200 (-) Transcript_6984:51-650(-)
MPSWGPEVHNSKAPSATVSYSCPLPRGVEPPTRCTMTCNGSNDNHSSRERNRSGFCIRTRCSGPAALPPQSRPSPPPAPLAAAVCATVFQNSSRLFHSFTKPTFGMPRTPPICPTSHGDVSFSNGGTSELANKAVRLLQRPCTTEPQPLSPPFSSSFSSSLCAGPTSAELTSGTDVWMHAVAGAAAEDMWSTAAIASCS